MEHGEPSRRQSVHDFSNAQPERFTEAELRRLAASRAARRAIKRVGLRQQQTAYQGGGLKGRLSGSRVVTPCYEAWMPMHAGSMDREG